MEDELQKIRSKFEKKMGDAWEKYDTEFDSDLEEYGEDYEKAYTYLFEAIEALLDHHIVAARIDELERIKKGDFYSGDHEDDLIEIDNHIGRRLTELRQQYKPRKESE